MNNMAEMLIAAPAEPRVEELGTRWCNLADARIGAAPLACSDEFFAPAARMLSPLAPVFIPDKYDDHGKWMDGWETRRRREPGHDWCVIRLGLAGIIKAVDIDTSHFTGNYPPEGWVEACNSDGAPGDDAQWVEIVPRSPLAGNSHNLFEVDDPAIYTHVRLNIAPDGGVARLKLFGKGQKDWSGHEPGTLVDLAALEHGGRVVAWNDAHFGHPTNIISPGRGKNMGDGWETRRRREPGNDWLILRLGTRGLIRAVEIDTAHFKGNYPDKFSLRAALIEHDDADKIVKASEAWPSLLEAQKLEADSVRRFDRGVADAGVVTHVRLDIFPDGGVSRLRLEGEPRPDRAKGD